MFDGFFSQTTRNNEDNLQFDILYGIPQINILYIITKYIQNKSIFSSLINLKCSTGDPAIDINLFGNPKLVVYKVQQIKYNFLLSNNFKVQLIFQILIKTTFWKSKTCISRRCTDRAQV